jgi:hypothetical protein
MSRALLLVCAITAVAGCDSPLDDLCRLEQADGVFEVLAGETCSPGFLGTEIFIQGELDDLLFGFVAPAVPLPVFVGQRFTSPLFDSVDPTVAEVFGVLDVEVLGLRQISTGWRVEARVFGRANADFQTPEGEGTLRGELSIDSLDDEGVVP